MCVPERVASRTGATARSVMCLSCKLRDPSSIPRAHRKCQAYTCKVTTEEMRAGRSPGLSGQPCGISEPLEVREPSSKGERVGGQRLERWLGALKKALAAPPQGWWLTTSYNSRTRGSITPSGLFGHTQAPIKYTQMKNIYSF